MRTSIPILAALLLVAGGASAQPTAATGVAVVITAADLDYRTESGLLCPSGADFARRMADEMGYDPFAPGAWGLRIGRFHVRVARKDPSFGRGLVATVSFDDHGTGVQKWLRTFETREATAAACDKLVGLHVLIDVAGELTVLASTAPAIRTRSSGGAWASHA
jgi:hypothetical protein